jgi:hypothetical protein
MAALSERQDFVPTQSAPLWRSHSVVDDLHTYYVLVGDAPVLVHNCPASKALNSGEQASVAWSDR